MVVTTHVGVGVERSLRVVTWDIRETKLLGRLDTLRGILKRKSARSGAPVVSGLINVPLGLVLGLATGAEICTTLCHCSTSNREAAFVARISTSTVDAKMVLLSPTLVNPVDAGTVVSNSVS